MKSIYLILTILFTSFTGIGVCQEAIKDNYESELTLTLQLISKTEAVNGLWRDTHKLVKQAQQAADKKNFGDAIALLEQAQFQAKAGYTQATSQDELDQLIPYYLK